MTANLEAILARLGTEWELADPVDAIARIRHRPTQIHFVLIQGGEFTMGLTDPDQDLVELFLGSRPALRAMVDGFGAISGPPTVVKVDDFLCADAPLSRAQVSRLAPNFAQETRGGVHRVEALQLAAQIRMRLPSEAELEWIARQGTQASFTIDCVVEAPEDDVDRVMVVDHPLRGRFGAGGFFDSQWAADDWFPSHAGRPDTATARTGGDPQGVRKFEFFDYEEIGNLAILNQLAARRVPGRGERALVRLVCDIPQE